MAYVYTEIEDNIRSFSHDVTAAILVYQANPLGIEIYFYANTFLFHWTNMAAGHVSENDQLTVDKMIFRYLKIRPLGGMTVL